MVVQEQQYKDMILSSLGQTATMPLTAQIDAIWEMNADRAVGVYVKLQYLTSRLQAIEWLRDNKHLYHQVSEQGVSEALNQVFANLDVMYKSAVEAIQREEARRRGIHGVATAPIEAVQPVPAPAVGPDPSHRGYRGDPLYRTGGMR